MTFSIIYSCTNSKNNNQRASLLDLKKINSPASDSCAEPYLFTDKNGSVYLSWIEKKGKELALKFSSYRNENWSAPVTIASGVNWFVNWADYPVISADEKGNIMAHYLEKSDTAKFTYDIKIISSSDSGKTWGNAKTIHDDKKLAEHGFVSIIPYEDNFFISWLDGRKTAIEETVGSHEGHHGEMTVRGAVINKSGIKINDWELDGRVCDCCQTSAAITDNGPVVVYRDRSFDEVRDMSIVRFVDGTWTKPENIFPDNWKIAGCPVNGPRTDAIGNNLVISWFSMAENNGKVNLVFSKDGGATFKKPVRIDEGKPIGRVDVVMLNENSAVVSWMEGSVIKAVKVNADGSKESSVIIGQSTESRSGGFPQMTKSGNKLFFAYTDSQEKAIKISTIIF